MMFGGFCAYCGVPLESGWHADHVKSVRRDYEYRHSSFELGQYKPSRLVRNGRVLRHENDVLENIYPACRACNIDKCGENLEDWREYLQDKMIAVMRRDIPNFRHAERFRLITVNPITIVFWFERYAPCAAPAGEGEGDI